MERTYSVPSRKNKDRRPINNESDWRRGQRRYIQQSEVCLGGKDYGVRKAGNKDWQELSNGLLAYIWTVHRAHALKNRGSRRPPEDDRGLWCVPNRGDSKGLTSKFYGHKHLSQFPHDAKRDFYQYYQTGETTNLKYLETFNNKISFIESYVGYIGTDLGVSKEELAGLLNPSDPDSQAAAESKKMKYFEAEMICGSDQVIYVNLVEELQNDFTKGN